MTVDRAYQSIRREQCAIEDKNNLFGAWWENIDTDLKKSVVKPISIKTASNMVNKYEWLGCMPAIAIYCYGVYFDDNLGGVVVFGKEYSENLGVWDKYGYTDKMLLLARGVCVHWTPKNTASKLIQAAIKMLPDKYRIITATVDRLAGEIGTIYQACNWYYVGSMRESNPNIKRNKIKRDAWLINGKLIGSRSMRALIGSQRKEDIMRSYPGAIYCEQLSKERYFYFRGNTKEVNSLKQPITHLIKPYPKRNDSAKTP